MGTARVAGEVGVQDPATLAGLVTLAVSFVTT